MRTGLNFAVSHPDDPCLNIYISFFHLNFQVHDVIQENMIVFLFTHVIKRPLIVQKN